MAEQKLIKLKINEREMQVPQGTLVIEATRRIGTEVPSFCYYPGLSLQAACRMCMVEVEKAPKLQTACTVIATEGMIVRTETEQVRSARKYMLEFLLTNHPLDCPVCDKGGECELQDMVFRYGADTSRFVEEKIHRPEEKWSELVYYDAPRCILCFRCVRVCDEGMDVKALGVGMRGANSVIIPNREDHLDAKRAGWALISVLVARSPAAPIATKRARGKCNMSRRHARTALTDARSRSACAITKSCARTIATSRASTAIFSASRAALVLISRSIKSVSASP